MRLLAMPSLTPFFGSLLRAKKPLSASPSASGSRSSPPTTIPAGEHFARELLHLGDAVVRDARGGELRRADLQADELLDRVTALPLPLPPPDERVGSDGIGNESFFQKGSCGPAGSGAGDTAAVPAGAPAFLRPNDTCFFQKGTLGAAGATSTGRAAVGAFASAASTDASSAGDRALLLRPSETCFFQNGVEAAFSLFSFGRTLRLRRLALGLRENESSFFQKGPVEAIR